MCAASSGGIGLAVKVATQLRAPPPLAVFGAQFGLDPPAFAGRSELALGGGGTVSACKEIASNLRFRVTSGPQGGEPGDGIRLFASGRSTSRETKSRVVLNVDISLRTEELHSSFRRAREGSSPTTIVSGPKKPSSPWQIEDYVPDRPLDRADGGREPKHPPYEQPALAEEEKGGST